MYLPDALSAAVSKYGFTGIPKNLEEMNADRVDLRHGKFQGVAIDALEIYGDGVVVSSFSDTSVLDAFLSDLMQWLQEDMGISIIESRFINKLYESNILFEADQSILKPLGAYAEIIEMIENSLNDATNLRSEFHSYGISFSEDPTHNPHLKPVPFRIERRAGAEFAYAQFFSSAPLKSKQHIAILEKLESLF